MLKRLVVALGGALTILLALIVLLTYKNIQEPLSLDKAQLITVEKGATINRFSRLLVKKGWLSTRFWLRNYVRINPEFAHIKTGTYQLSPNITVLELLKLVVSGKEHQFSITFIEGSTFKEWRSLLAQNDNISQTIQDLSEKQLLTMLGSNKEKAEGLFFPETYAFTQGTADVTILKRAYKQMETLLGKHWQQRQDNLPYQSPYEALIMASIIEKESGKAAEHQTISSVFVNRLNKKMRLQTDPTVIYGLGDSYNGDIKRVHLKQYTPYNTYKIKGLPPTPIAMPGKNAIYAALNPSSTDYYYFVSNGAGEHVFSRNLADHNKAVRDYLNRTSNR